MIEFTSLFWARCLSTWSIRVSANIASAIGVALIPTQGSWRPVVETLVFLPCLSMLSTLSRILEVGLSAIETSIS